jgi:uncharacterized repeat protein (TIGR02543 family)
LATDKIAPVKSARSGISKALFATLISLLLFSVGIPVASAANYTVTYDANASQHQSGFVTGTVPNPGPLPQGTISLATNSGNLARQGFTFAGWNTLANGAGTTYAPGASFNLTANVTLYAKWEIPVAARLIGNGGTLVTVVDSNAVSNGSKCTGAGIRGITSDGTHIYYRPSTFLGFICKATPAGVLISVHEVTGLAALSADSLALVYGNGCLYIRKDTTTTLDSIYCITISASATWSMTSVPLKNSDGTATLNLPAGGTWLYGNFIQFPDGRIGSVGTSVAAASFGGGGKVGTGQGQCPSGMYCKILRLYTVSGTGAGMQARHSTDFILADSTASWPDDDHGIATDGTYLYQIRHAYGYKVWALRADGPSYLVFNGDGSGACGASSGTSGTLCTITYPVNGLAGGGSFSNGTYLGRAHGLNKYLIGDYSGSSKFWLSDAAIPPDGPGNPDVVAPRFTSTETFTVNENVAPSFSVATVNVNESSTLTISGGVDQADFTITRSDTASAIIRFAISPDYEAPADSGGNNVYNITISATDAAGNAGNQSINITVINLNESSSISTPSVSGTIYKGVTITLTVTVNAPGKVRFYMDGKRIANCLSIATTGAYPNFSATCSWKPAVTQRHTVHAALTPSDPSFSASTSQVGEFWVIKRTSRR